MVESLSKSQVAEFTEAFKLFDKDGDGKISKNEFRSVMVSLGLSPTPQEIQKLIGEVDINLSGSIELSEFLKMMENHMKSTDSEEEMKEIFKVFDRNEEGYITTFELRNVMANLGEKLDPSDLDEMIKIADRQGTGRVTFEDFVAIVTTK